MHFAHYREPLKILVSFHKTNSTPTEIGARWGKDGGKRLSLCTTLRCSKGRSVYLSLHAELVENMKRSRLCMCGWKSLFPPTCLFASTLNMCPCWNHLSKQARPVVDFLQNHRLQWVTWKPRININEAHLRYLICSQEMAWYVLQLCMKTRASGWDLDGKQPFHNRWLSAFKLNYWQWVKINDDAELSWSYFFLNIHVFRCCALNVPPSF